MNKVLFKLKAVRTLQEEPVFLRPIEGTVSENIAAVKGCNGLVYPAQKYDDGAIVIVTAREGEEICMREYDEASFGGVKIEKDTEKDALHVSIAGEKFSDYVYDPKFDKPYFGAVLDSHGHPFTRLDFYTHEHPHHRSLFIGVGDVNGTDCWNEGENGGLVRVGGIHDIEYGAAYGCFSADSVWQTKDGVKLVDDTTRYMVYNQDGHTRYLDIEITFKASYGDVAFGATKEAGPLGIRVRDDMRVDIGTGVMRNSYGAVSEAECWSKSAHWCDFSANIQVEKGVYEDMGITVFDNEGNERYPTAWHIRDYGLFAANNLYFKGGLTIKSGESLTYRYRVLFREGKFDQQDITNRFLAYALQK